MTSASPPTAEVLAQAAARRAASTEASTSDAQLMQDHEKRQHFRRLIDPGIFRPNSREVAMSALKILSTIAENVLREPENTRYHTFKHENDTIKRRLIEPKGTLEYALALGFHPKVVEFQSYYVFHPSRIADLRIGAAILREALGRETEREGRQQKSRQEQKAAEAVIAQNVKLAFLDDRKNKMIRDQRERQLREARESARGSQTAPVISTSPPLPDQSPSPMPGRGYTLTSDVQEDQPPPYHD